MKLKDLFFVFILISGIILTTGCGSKKEDKCKDVKCPSGQTCNADTGKCEGQTTSKCANVKCDPCEKCNEENGKCEYQCTDAQVCDEQNNKCVGKCDLVDCPEGRVCNPDNGKCECPDNVCPVEDGAIGASCSSDDDCRAAGPNKSCFTEDQGLPGGYCTADCSLQACPEGSTEVSLYGQYCRCMKTCKTDADCREGYSCDNIDGKNICNPKSTCTNDSDCPEGQVCKLAGLFDIYYYCGAPGGQIQRWGQCDVDVDIRNADPSELCPDKYLCIGTKDTCTNDFKTPSTCDNDNKLVCDPYEKTCTVNNPCNDVTCGENEICDENGQCQQDQCAGVTRQGVCSSVCRSNADCKDGFTCVGTYMLLDDGGTPCDDSDDKLGLVGICVEGKSCERDADCDAGQVCQITLSATDGELKGICSEPDGQIDYGQQCNYDADITQEDPSNLCKISWMCFGTKDTCELPVQQSGERYWCGNEMLCGSDNTCSLQDKCVGVTCDAGKICDPTNGNCVDNPCQPNRWGVCSSMCKTTDDCPTGMLCAKINFSISDNGTPCDTSDDPKAAARICYPWSGSGTACTKDEDCQNGESCQIFIDENANPITICGTNYENGAAVGETCNPNNLDSCYNALCLSSGIIGYCSEICSDSSDCLDGYNCTPVPVDNQGHTVNLCVK